MELIENVSCNVSCCRDVISVLEDWGTERRETEITRITVTGAGVESVNGDYRPVAGDRCFKKFHPKVCNHGEGPY